MTDNPRPNPARRLRLAAWLLLAAALSGAAGCTATGPAPRPVTAACDHPERDLTRPWAERRYWCVPAGLRLAGHATPASGWRGAIAPSGPTVHGPRP